MEPLGREFSELTFTGPLRILLTLPTSLDHRFWGVETSQGSGVQSLGPLGPLGLRVFWVYGLGLRAFRDEGL